VKVFYANVSGAVRSRLSYMSRGPNKNHQPNDRQRALATGMLKHGKTFKQSALDAGYSPTVAKQGPAFMRSHSIGVDMAFVEASKQLTWQPEEVKAVIRARLMADLTRGKSSGVERVAELLGRDKTVDMFVRNGDMQIGIFAEIGDKDLDTLTVTAKQIAATEPAKE